MSYPTYSAAYPKGSSKTPEPPSDLLTPENDQNELYKKLCDKAGIVSKDEIQEIALEVYNLLYPIICLKKFITNYLGNPCQIIFRLIMLIILVYFIKYY